MSACGQGFTPIVVALLAGQGVDVNLQEEVGHSVLLCMLCCVWGVYDTSSVILRLNVATECV